MSTRWLAFTLIPLAACGSMESTAGDEATQAEAAALTTETSNVEGSLQTVATASLTMAEMTSGDMAAAAAAKGAGAHLKPMGCYTAVASGNKVTYSFNSCTGPYGLVRANGLVVATFTPVQGGLKVDVVANSFKVNDTTVNVAFSGTFTMSGNTKKATINSTSSATSAKGRSITRTGSYTVTWDGMCITLDGAFATTLGSANYATTFTALKRCETGCPSGAISFVGPGGAMTLTYDGTARAKWTVGIKSGTVALLCIP